MGRHDGAAGGLPRDIGLSPRGPQPDGVQRQGSGHWGGPPSAERIRRRDQGISQWAARSSHGDRCQRLRCASAATSHVACRLAGAGAAGAWFARPVLVCIMVGSFPPGPGCSKRNG